MFENPDDRQRCALLRETRTIAVVGLSPKPDRPSYGVSAGMQRYGFRIIPVRPATESILGEKAYSRLADVPVKIDLVNVFRTAEFVDGIVEECIALGIPAIWIQEGIVNDAAAQRALAAGMKVVMDRCIYRDYRRICVDMH